MNDDIQQKQQDLVVNIAKDPYVAMRFARHMRSQEKPIPDIILKSIINEPLAGSNFALELARDYILLNDPVPEILLDRIITNSKNSYYIAKYYKKNNQQIPDKVLKSVQNSPFARLSFDEDEEQSNEPAIKQELRKKILADPKYALRYAKVLVQNGRPVPDSVEDSFTDSPESANEYAKTIISNNGEVSQKIFDIIEKDNYQSFDFANSILQPKVGYGPSNAAKIAPLQIIKSLAKYSGNATAYATEYLKQVDKYDKTILDILENGIKKGVTVSFKGDENKDISENVSKYVMAYVDSVGELPSKEMLKLTKAKSLVYISNILWSQNKEIPQEIIDTIAKNGSASYAFVARYKMLKGGKTLPSIYKKIENSARNYNENTI